MYGINALSTCEEPAVDIVFVHGLRGDSRRTWLAAPAKKPLHPKGILALKLSKAWGKKTAGNHADQPSQGSQSAIKHEEHAVFWPQDFLAPEFPEARILTYGYDASISTILNKTNDRSIFSIAQDLVTRLEMFRESNGTDTVPIIFIAHSLGGLVVKDALKFSQDQNGFQHHLHSIFASTYGVIFFGTPHRGSEMASLGKIAANIAGLGLAESEQYLLKSLEQGSTELQRIGDAFSRMLPQQAKGLKVYTFQEGLPLTSIRFAGKVVEDWSSIIGDALEGKAVIQANHMEMCRFSEKDHPDYVLVSGVIRRWIRDIQKGKNRERVAKELSRGPNLDLDVENSSEFSSHKIPAISLTGNSLPAFRLPQVPTRHFLGRDRELSMIYGAFQKQESSRAAQKIVVLHGMGGVGKTQLALTYAHQHRQSYKAIFWINARNDQTIISGYLQVAQSLVDWAAEMRGSALNFTRIAYELGLGQSVSPSTGEVTLPSANSRSVTDAMKAWLEKPNNNGWLLVFDSADDLEGIDLQYFFPAAATGDILVTSRRSQASQLGAAIEITTLDLSDAREVLFKMSQADDSQDELDFDPVATALGNLPLALAQAGSYMAATKTSPAAYLKQYATRRKELLSQKPPKALWQYEEGVLTTWEISFSSIELRSPPTARLLLLCGYLQPENIPYLLFKLGVVVEGRRASVWQSLGSQAASSWRRLSEVALKKLALKHQNPVLTSTPWLQALVMESELFHSSIQLLCDYSLISVNQSEDGFTMHPLIHSWCYLRHLQPRLDLAVEAAILIGRAVDWDHTVPSAWEMIRDFQPIMLEFAAKFLGMDLAVLHVKKEDLNLLQALEAIAGCLEDIERHGEARRLFEVTYKLAIDALGQKHPLTLATLDQLAMSLEHEGCLAEAECLRRELVYSTRQALGRKNPDFWTYQHNLGKLLVDQEKYEEAQTILERVAEFRFKEGDDSVISSMMNLGVIYLEKGQLDRSEKVFRDAKAHFERFPDYDPSTYFQAVGWLGYVMSESGRRSECEDLMTSAIKVAEAKYGRENPLVLQWLKALLDFYTEDISVLDEQRIAEMVAIAEHLVKTWPIVRGPADRNVPPIQKSFGDFWFKIGGFERGKGWLEDAVQNLDTRLAINLTAKDCSLKGDVLNSLAMLYWDRGLLTEATKYWKETISIYESPMLKNAKNSEISILSARANLAVTLRDERKLSEAESALKQVIQEEIALYGKDIALLTRNNLATVYHLQGQHSESLALFQSILNDVKPESEDDQSILIVKHNLACLHETMGHLDEAICLLESTFNRKEIKLGLRSPATLKTALTLSRMYKRRQRVEDAKKVADKIRPFLEHA